MHVITQSCLLFIWVHTLNVVTAQDCKLADFLSGSYYDSNLDTSGLDAFYPPGAQVRVSCHAGFVGFFKLRCFLDGWYHHQDSKCEDLTCPRPPADGEIDIQDLPVNNGPIHVNHTITFSCSPPKRLNGISELTCEGTGQWNEAFPFCEVACEVPQLPANLHITNQPQTSLLWKGDELQFRCSGILYLQGSEHIECLADGNWSDKVPICSETNSCGAPPHLDDGDVKDTPRPEYNYGEIVEYVCQSLYVIEGGSRTCQNGQWVGDVKCLKPCTVDEEDMNRNNIQFRHSHEHKLYLEHNTHITFICKFRGQTSNIALRQRCIDGTITLPSCSR